MNAQAYATAATLRGRALPRRGAVFAVLLGLAVTIGSEVQGAPATQDPASAKPSFDQIVGKLSLSFEANQGQTDSQVKFLSRGHGFTLFLTPTESVLGLRERGTFVRDPQRPRLLKPQGPVQEAFVHFRLVGANPSPEVVGEAELPGRANYFVDSNPDGWRTNIPTFAKVRFHHVYPGIDLVYYGTNHQLEYDFIVQPGADPDQISLRFEGATGLTTDPQGDLVLQTSVGEVRYKKPLIYQEVDGVRKEVSGGFILRNLNSQGATSPAYPEVGFEVGAYDKASPLIIDPVFVFMTYLGGTNDEIAQDVAADSAGNLYMVGYTASMPWPLLSQAQGSTPYQGTNRGGLFDAFVAKLDPPGKSIIWWTYIGGSYVDAATGGTIDANGNAYIIGYTCSPNFPTTVNATYPQFRGGTNVTGSCLPGTGSDAFFVILNSTGSQLLFSTFYGGSNDDRAYEAHYFSVKSGGTTQNYVAFTGDTASTNFPVTNASQFGGGIVPFDAMAVVFLIPQALTTAPTVSLSTYLGGSGDDSGQGVTSDSSGNVYVGGATDSTNFPVLGAYQSTKAGGVDAFITRLNLSGSITYSTYLGGSNDDWAGDVKVDASGNMIAGGITYSTNFPVTAATALQSTLAGGSDAFIAKLVSKGLSLGFSTYLGGSSIDGINGLAMDTSGNLYATGFTYSTNFPVVNAAGLQGNASGGEDAFLAKFNPSGSAFVPEYSGYLGGSFDDEGRRVDVDAAGNLYVAGFTNSVNFPTAPFGSTVQNTLGGGYDFFVGKVTTGNTAAGQNVAVQPVDTTSGTNPVTLTFSTITNPGTTGLTTSSSGPAPPANYQPGQPTIFYTYSVSSTALFTGSVRVCINYTGTTFINESAIKLFNYENGTWVDRTTSLDTTNHVICATVTSLSQMAIFEPVPIGGGPTPFAGLTARTHIILNPGVQDDRFWVKANVALGVTSDGIFPTREPVTIQLGTFRTTIAAGSFVQSGSQTGVCYKFDGTVGGVALKVRFIKLVLGNFRFYVKGAYADLTGTVVPVPFTLTVGNDSGKFLIPLKGQPEVWLGIIGAKIIDHQSGNVGGQGSTSKGVDEDDEDDFSDAQSCPS